VRRSTGQWEVTLPNFDRVAYVRGFMGSRPSVSMALAASIPGEDEGLVDRKLTLKWAVNQRITTRFSSIRSSTTWRRF